MQEQDNIPVDSTKWSSETKLHEVCFNANTTNDRDQDGSIAAVSSGSNNKEASLPLKAEPKETHPDKNIPAGETSNVSTGKDSLRDDALVQTYQDPSISLQGSLDGVLLHGGADAMPEWVLATSDADEGVLVHDRCLKTEASPFSTEGALLSIWQELPPLANDSSTGIVSSIDTASQAPAVDIAQTSKIDEGAEAPPRFGINGLVTE